MSSNSPAQSTGSSDGDRSPVSSFSELHCRALAVVLSTVKASTSLAAVDVDFQRATDSEFGPVLDDCNERLLTVTSQLMAGATAGSDIPSPQLKGADDIETKWGRLVRVIDSLLEKADTLLDEYTGAIKERSPGPLPKAMMPTAPQSGRGMGNTMWGHAYIEKPQLSFRERVDNLDTSPWKPILTSKPHAEVPLEESIHLITNSHGANEYISKRQRKRDGRFLMERPRYAHPYQTEIESMEYPREAYTWLEPTAPEPWNKVPATWVGTPDALQDMILDMQWCTEIAVDLEHHDRHTYGGITCLMQLSTRENDYIVDTLKLREQLQPLNTVFANPKVIKVLHGADMDIIWLQRDLGLYIVGLFDTRLAAQALELAGCSLAFILKEYMGFEADKKYQLADWRTRPLSPEMLEYARADTHFLLYCFDRMRNQLVEDPRRDIQMLLRKSKEVALRRYFRDVYDPVWGSGSHGWAQQLVNSEYNRAQVEVFKAVHAWRDAMARKLDESPTWILSRHGLGKLCTVSPTNFKGVLNCLPYNCRIPRRHAGELAGIIKRALSGRSQTVEGNCAPATPNFWGESSRVGESRLRITAAEATLLNERESKPDGPLPELTATAFASTATFASLTPERLMDSGARAPHQHVKDHGSAKEKEAAAVNSLSGSRKRKAQKAELDDDDSMPIALDYHNSSADWPNSSPSNDWDDFQRHDEGPPEVNSPRGGWPGSTGVHKRYKYSGGRGRLQQWHRKAGKSGTRPFDAPDAPPLDNPKVSSVLHTIAVTNDNDSRKPSTGRKFPGSQKFNPYPTSGRGPKGIRRNQCERAGKLLTFKDHIATNFSHCNVEGRWDGAAPRLRRGNRETRS